ncbi:MAG: hypothetical protein JSV50_21930 [Desulfobacteraceae bacterium]|nr:MAG: hypothetical protein JSV50_21930 [Desulfobacteraceae bacterium]
MALEKSKQETKKYKSKLIAKNVIGTLGEKGLHSALKDWYAMPGDCLETEVDGFHIDIIRNNLFIEIQTPNFSAIKKKLNKLTDTHSVRLVFPIAQEKWIVRLASDGATCLGRRKSPKKGHLLLLFEELVSIPGLIKEKNFSLEVLLIREEEIRCDDGQGSWRRRGWSVTDHRLLEVVIRHVFGRPSDFLALIPADLSDPFTTLELAKGIEQPRWLAQKMAYCLRHMGAIEVVGKNGNSLLYSTLETVE